MTANARAGPARGADDHRRTAGEQQEAHDARLRQRDVVAPRAPGDRSAAEARDRGDRGGAPRRARASATCSGRGPGERSGAASKEDECGARRRAGGCGRRRAPRRRAHRAAAARARRAARCAEPTAQHARDDARGAPTRGAAAKRRAGAATVAAAVMCAPCPSSRRSSATRPGANGIRKPARSSAAPVDQVDGAAVRDVARHRHHRDLVGVPHVLQLRARAPQPGRPGRQPPLRAGRAATVCGVSPAGSTLTTRSSGGSRRGQRTRSPPASGPRAGRRPCRANPGT